MYLIVSIDTEEDMPKWRPEPVTTVKNIHILPEINDLFARHSVRTTYLTDRPVLCDDESCKIIKQLSTSGTCEIGMHLHSWNTPPVMSEEAQGRATVLNLYPREIQEEKITGLHQYFMERLGFAPTSYRAGRYGLTKESAEILAKLEYLADSSVVPLTDYSDYGAPNYRNHNHKPFWIKRDLHGDLLEIPVTVDLVTRFPQSFYDLYFAIPNWTRIKGVLNRLNLARMAWLRPTNYTYKEMKQLADFIIRKSECPVFNIMFHSSELYPGASPYNLTEKHVSEFIDRLLRIIRHLTGTHKAVSVTLSEFAKLAKAGDDRLNYAAEELQIFG